MLHKEINATHAVFGKERKKKNKADHSTIG